MVPTNFSPWESVYQQTQRWLTAGCFEEMAHDLRVLRWLQTWADTPSATILDSRTLRTTSDTRTAGRR